MLIPHSNYFTFKLVCLNLSAKMFRGANFLDNFLSWFFYQMVPDETQSVLFCSRSIFEAIWAHISIRLAPAWIVSGIKTTLD